MLNKFNTLLNGSDFYLNPHKSKLLDPEYIFYYLRSTRSEYGFDRVFRANLNNVRNLVSVKIPVNKKGEFCILRQNKIAKKYRYIDSLKRNTCKVIESLCDVNINI